MDVILGNGLTAKIFAFYNREYQLIGNDTSMTTDHIANNMIFLQDNKWNRKLVEDVAWAADCKIPCTPKKIRVLYFNGREYVSKINQEASQKIIDKKLTDVNGKRLKFRKSVFEDTLQLSCANKQNRLEYLSVDFGRIMGALRKLTARQVLNTSKIIAIDTEKKKIYLEGVVVDYNKLVSTLSAPLFYKLAFIKSDDFDTLDTTIVETTEEKLGIPPTHWTSAILYFPESQHKFSKVIKRHGKCYAEYTGIIETQEPHAYVKQARLIAKKIVPPTDDITFLGRFAEWNPDNRIQDNVRKASSKNTMESIFTNQRRFSSMFFDFSEDLKLIQSNIKEMSLLMQDEVFSLMSLINWKNHNKENKKLDFEKVKEELVDIGNYWLTLCAAVGMNYNEYIDAHEKKQKKLEEKYANYEKKNDS
jgi:NTP pyrophosphatase (non-canonical NTP hydrolase)